jgi:hypothetical protein
MEDNKVPDPENLLQSLEKLIEKSEHNLTDEERKLFKYCVYLKKNDIPINLNHLANEEQHKKNHKIYRNHQGFKTLSKKLWEKVRSILGCEEIKLHNLDPMIKNIQEKQEVKVEKVKKKEIITFIISGYFDQFDGNTIEDIINLLENISHNSSVTRCKKKGERVTINLNGTEKSEISARDIYLIDENLNQESQQIPSSIIEEQEKLNQELVMISEILYPQGDLEIFRKRSTPFSLGEWVTVLMGYLKSAKAVQNLLKVDYNVLSELASNNGEKVLYPRQIASIKETIQGFISTFLTDSKINIFDAKPEELGFRIIDFHLAQQCREIIDGYFIDEALKSLIDRRVNNRNVLDDVNASSKKRVHPNYLRGIYREVGILIPPTRFDAFAKKSFIKLVWDSIIHKPQLEQRYENHLHYSNAFIAREVSSKLRNSMNERNSEFKYKGYIRILEGGVGGANTTQTVLRELKNMWEREEFKQDKKYRDLRVQYLGYEINSKFVARGMDFLLGVAEDDPRSNFFDKFPLLRWDGQKEFIIAKNMFDGVKELVEPERYNERYNESVHAFICSYAFHHIPNGSALKNHLFFSDTGFGQPRSQLFRDILESILNPNPQSSSENFPKSTQEYLQARAFAEYIRNPEIRNSKDFFDTIQQGIERRPSSEDISDYLGSCLVNPKLEMLRNIRKLLIPGGILAIADPDGLSSFNAEQIIIDPEMTVAHFLNIQEIEELLEEAHFQNIKSYTVGKTKEHLFEIVDPADRSDFIDPNLGYIVFAQRPMNMK